VKVDKSQQDPDDQIFWRILSFVSFAFVIALFVMVSSRAGMRGMGLTAVVHSITLFVTQKIPYGIEGREPIGNITGLPAVLIAMLILVIGVAMLVLPDFMLDLFGWSDE
jgi:hypothetical protein